MCTVTCFTLFFFLMIRRPPRSTLDRSSAASDVYKRQYYIELVPNLAQVVSPMIALGRYLKKDLSEDVKIVFIGPLSLIHISEPTRPY